MNPLAPFLEKFGFAMLDGGISTELERHGADLDDPLWTSRVLLDAPGLIDAMHRAFLENGADVIATTTYQASIEGFEQAGLDASAARRIMREAVAMAVAARNAFWSIPANRHGRLRPLVAVSLGPYGACLHDGSEYHGDYAADTDTIRAFHRERIAVLADAGGDLFAFETIPSLAEAELRILAIEKAALRIGNRELEQRLHRIAGQGRAVLEQVVARPEERFRARKFLNVYLEGAERVASRYAQTHRLARGQELEQNFRNVLTEIETVFGRQLNRLAEHDVFDLDVQIEVLRKQLEREGIT